MIAVASNNKKIFFIFDNLNLSAKIEKKGRIAIIKKGVKLLQCQLKLTFPKNLGRNRKFLI
jgi:hypothetical protein